MPLRLRLQKYNFFHYTKHFRENFSFFLQNTLEYLTFAAKSNTMKTIKDIYKIGIGPSSSHTMGPQKAASIFNERYPNAASFEVTLYGSLAATGKGHMTDWAILNTLKAPTEIV